ncbi:hypothetical protein MLPF_0859 [Mycobacterium lepromatosis]|nr:hypothetical protein MLPF_0859 [Mycobacterium lepromatosis]
MLLVCETCQPVTMLSSCVLPTLLEYLLLIPSVSKKANNSLLHKHNRQTPMKIFYVFLNTYSRKI